MSNIEHITVNQFTFCAEHGDEYCQACCCDHRMSNNVKIDAELHEISEFLDGEVEVSTRVPQLLCQLLCLLDHVIAASNHLYSCPQQQRHPLNAFARGAVPAIHTEESFQCEKHKTVDCPGCFDWTLIIKQEAKEADEGGRWMSKRNSLQEQLESGVLTAVPLDASN